MRTKRKTFDCVAMKHAAQDKIRQKVMDMTRDEEIAFFRSGADEFQRRLRAAKRSSRKRRD